MVVLSCRVSHDRGKCFQKFPLDTTGHFVLKGLVGDFKVGSLVGLAFGVPTRANNSSEWIVHAIKFSNALVRPCELILSYVGGIATIDHVRANYTKFYIHRHLLTHRRQFVKLFDSPQNATRVGQLLFCKASTVEKW